jgi:hypothetical protein
LRSGGKRENRRRVVKIPDRQTRGAGGIEPERASAARGHEKMRPPRRAQQPKSGKPLVAHAVDRQGDDPFAGRRYDDRPPRAKFGKTTLYCDLLGRAKQTRRSTPSHFYTHTSLGRADRKTAPTAEERAPAHFIPLGASFSLRAFAVTFRRNIMARCNRLRKQVFDNGAWPPC